MISIVNFFNERCCSRRHKHCHIDLIPGPQVKVWEPDQAAKRFRAWVMLDGHNRITPIWREKMYGTEEGELTPPDKLLVWLWEDLGYKHIATYEHFRQLAEVLSIEPCPSERIFGKIYGELLLKTGGEEARLRFAHTIK